MIGIHVIHRRLAQLSFKACQLGGYRHLSDFEQQEMEQCLKINEKMVRTLDELKQLSLIAYQIEDFEWVHEICGQIEQLEARML